MSDRAFTEREQEYLDCETPLLSAGQAAGRIFMGVFASMAVAVFSPSPGYSKADKGLMRTIREIRYTKYKKAVLRKESGALAKNDEKLLRKLNQQEFVFAVDQYDPDKFTQQVYEEYMKNRSEK